MRIIAKGRMYDTETAKKLGSYDNGLFTTDFKYRCEELYKKTTGEYFLTIELYDVVLVSPATEKEAKEWCEKHLTAEEYISIFGEVEE